MLLGKFIEEAMVIENLREGGDGSGPRKMYATPTNLLEKLKVARLAEARCDASYSFLSLCW